MGIRRIKPFEVGLFWIAENVDTHMPALRVGLADLPWASQLLPDFFCSHGEALLSVESHNGSEGMHLVVVVDSIDNGGGTNDDFCVFPSSFNICEVIVISICACVKQNIISGEGFKSALFF